MSRKATSLVLAALFAIAATAMAQNADPNTAGPTKNQLRLRVTEPRQGATVAGSSVRVAVDYAHDFFGEGEGTKFSPRYPAPQFDIYLDGELKQTLKGEQNVAVIENVPAGSHKIAVVAKNISNEIIDRKEIDITNTEASISASGAASGPASGSSEPAPAKTDPSASATSGTSANSSTADANAGSASSPTAQRPARSDNRTDLPATGTSYPGLALLGLSLAASGLLLRRAGR
jgi:LPXTG-motif cell wall-anchored protein